jgi:hypothetical protein
VEQVSTEIHVGQSDPEVDAILAGIAEGERPYRRHFNQGGEFFLDLEAEYDVPHLPIHHDVRRMTPETDYLAALKGVVREIARLAPQVMRGLSWFFDPAEILRPSFFHIHQLGDRLYLYLLKIDLMMKPVESTVVERGTNDRTPWYRSRRLFLESTFIPLEQVVREDDRLKAFRIIQTISQTWIGEFGRGYFQQGIWMDADLTRFFSRLFLPPDRRTYPYYPYQCRYKTVCFSSITLSPDGRASVLPGLHNALEFLRPVMDEIQSGLKGSTFSEDMPLYRELKAKVPQAWYEPWQSLRVESYLNGQDLKEFRIED